MAASAAAPLVGKRVVVHGLLGRPELNGSTGDVQGFREESGRYVVQIGTQEVALRAANLRVADARVESFEANTRVRVHGLTGREELNGQCGLVAFWNEAKGRYGVQVDGIVAPVLLRVANLQPQATSRRAEQP